METRQLGKDGPQVPVLGLGAWPLGGGMGRVEERAAIATVRAAIDSGMTLIDTAQAYQNSEAVLGRALKNGYRERCFLATKVSGGYREPGSMALVDTGGYSRAGIYRALENSLKALAVDYVDLYQIHRWDPRYPIDAVMETLSRLQQEGKTRYIGVSNFSVPQMRQALQSARFQSNQVGYNMFDRDIEDGVIPFCAEEGIGILAYSPLAKGLLTGKYKQDHRFPPDDERSGYDRFQGGSFARHLSVAGRLAVVAQEKGVSLVQLALAWVLRQPAVTCVLVGAKSPAQVREHVPAAAIKFHEDELARIETILAGVHPT